MLTQRLSVEPVSRVQGLLFVFEAVVGVARLYLTANQRAALHSGVCVFQAPAALPFGFKGAERPQTSRLPSNGTAGGGAQIRQLPTPC